MLGQGTMPNEEEVSLTSKKIHADIKKKDAGWTLLPSSAVSSRDVRSLACLVRWGGATAGRTAEKNIDLSQQAA